MSQTREPTDEELEAHVEQTVKEVEDAKFNLSDEGWTWLRLGARVTAYRLLSQAAPPHTNLDRGQS